MTRRQVLEWPRSECVTIGQGDGSASRKDRFRVEAGQIGLPKAAALATEAVRDDDLTQRRVRSPFR